MESKATSLLLLSLVLSFMWLASVPGAEAQLIIPCKTSKECKAVRCVTGSAQCIVKQCQCPDSSPQSLSREMESLPCKTSNDCKSVLHCVSGYPVCMESECRCSYV